MKTNGLSYNSRKALMVNIGEAAGTEIANLIAQMAAEIEELRASRGLFPEVRNTPAISSKSRFEETFRTGLPSPRHSRRGFRRNARGLSMDPEPSASGDRPEAGA